MTFEPFEELASKEMIMYKGMIGPRQAVKEIRDYLPRSLMPCMLSL